VFYRNKLFLLLLSDRFYSSLKLLVIGSVIAFLSACGGGGGGGGGDEVASPTRGLKNNVYLPNSANSSWYYNNSSDATVFSGSKRVGGDSLDVLNYPTNGKEYYFTDSNTVGLRGFYSPYIYVRGVGTFSADFVFDKNLVLWQQGLAEGGTTTINTQGTVNISPTYGVRSIDVSGTSTFNGVESVTVPYGTFEAARIRFTLNISATIEGAQISIPWKGEMWLVEGFGIVKRIENGVTFQLTNYEGEDSDGDLVANIVDAFPNDADEYLDTDSDGIGNNSDPDDDNDGILDEEDHFPLIYLTPNDWDGDGVNNDSDNDDDNDGYEDGVDYYPNDPAYTKPLVVDKTKLSFSPILGSSEKELQEFTISGDSLGWSLTTQVPWLQVSNDAGTGGASVSVVVDGSTLLLGEHAATLTLTNLYDNEEIEIDISVTMLLPTFSFTQELIEIDGSDGWENAVGLIGVSLNTGISTYDLSSDIIFSVDDTVSLTSPSVVNETIEDITVTVDPKTLSKGMHEGQLTLSANVKGHVVTTTVDVKVLASEHLILVPDSGVALSKFVTVGKVSHSVDILDSYGFSDTRWSAVTEALWLNVTASGSTSDVLVITADATGLEKDAFYSTTISVQSNSDVIDNVETINVGFWVGSSDPSSVAELSGQYTELSTDPVRPYVYMHETGATGIDVYNVYDQSFVKRIEAVGLVLGDMEVSANGDFLYVADLNGSHSIVVVDLNNPSNRTMWSSEPMLFSGFSLSRTQGKDLLLTPFFGNIHDAKTGFVYFDGAGHMDSSTYMDVSLFGNRYCQLRDSSGISCYDLNYDDYHNEVSVSLIGTITAGGGSRGVDIALSKDGGIAYGAENGYWGYSMIDVSTMLWSKMLSSDRQTSIAIEMGPDDKAHGVSAKWEGKILDSYSLGLWIYGSDGELDLSTLGIANSYSVYEQKLAVSGDGSVSIILADDPGVVFLNSFD